MASSTFNPAGTGPAASTSSPTSAVSSTPATSPSTTGPAVSSPAAVTPSVSPAAVTPSTSPTTAAPSTAGPATSSPASTTSNDDNIAVLRQSHETLKGLGDLNTVRDGLGVYQNIWREANSLGNSLQYTQESLQAAFKADPVGTINLLREEKRQADANRDPDEDRIASLVDRQMAPYREQQARVQADSHNKAIDVEFTKMFNANDAFKARNGVEAPAEIRGIIRDRFIETLKWQPQLLKEVISGKYSGLQKIFDEVTTDTLNGWSKYNSWGQPSNVSTASTGQRGPDGKFVASPPNAFKGSLDDIIEGNESANALPSMRGFR